MDVLVIGGNGFIGSHVVDECLARGYGVRVLDRRPEAFRDPLPAVDYAVGDLGDPPAVFEALAGVDAVIHLASTTVPATSNLDPVGDITGNLVATVRLLDTMRKAGVRRLVYLSSGGTVYGIPERDPVPEEHPLRPISSYGVVKVAIENYLAMEGHLHGLTHVVLRASNPYGPRQGHRGIQGLIGTLLWKAARGEGAEVWGDGSVVRDFIHVRDLARLCVLAAQSPRSACWNAGSGEGRSVAEVVEMVRRVAGGPDVERRLARAFDVPRVVLDVARVRRETGWSPGTPLDKGMAETWDWVRARVMKEPPRTERLERAPGGRRDAPVTLD